MAKISVIVPVYGVEKYIKKCLLSIINQSYKNLEIIVINDSTPDKSMDIVYDLQKNDNRIKIFHQENSGQGVARNYGINESTGDYIMFVDSDDYINPKMIEDMYDLMMSNGADLSICGQQGVDEDYNLIKTGTTTLFGSYGNIVENPNFLNINFGPCNKLFKSELIKNNKLYFLDKKLVWYEDLPFVLACVLMAKKIVYTNQPYYYYLIRNNSTMNNNNVSKNLDIITSYDYLNTLLDSKYYYDCICYVAINQILISSSVRILNINVPFYIKKPILCEIFNYIKNNFPDYRSNKYLYLLGKKRKLIYELLIHKKYRLVNIVFKMIKVVK